MVWGTGTHIILVVKCFVQPEIHCLEALLRIRGHDQLWRKPVNSDYVHVRVLRLLLQSLRQPARAMSVSGHVLMIGTRQKVIYVLVELLDPRFRPLHVVCSVQEPHYPPL